jgi:biotin transport system substrate-specific component
MKRTNVRMLVLTAMFTALTAICAQISIPLPNVPINLALLAIHLAGAVLGARYGLAGAVAYLLLGAAGLPVFSGFRGGIGALTGITGGYLAGYALCALLTGLLCRGSRSLPALCLGMVPGTLLCYALGTTWLTVAAKMPYAAALSAGTLPFLPGDAVKILLAAYLTQKLRSVPAVRTALNAPESGNQAEQKS